MYSTTSSFLSHPHCLLPTVPLMLNLVGSRESSLRRWIIDGQVVIEPACGSVEWVVVVALVAVHDVGEGVSGQVHGMRVVVLVRVWRVGVVGWLGRRREGRIFVVGG